MHLRHFLSLLLAAELSIAATDSLAHSPEEMRAEIGSYLVDNPGVLQDVLSLLREQRDNFIESSDNWLQNNFQAVTDDGYSVVAGNPDGDLTLVEFYDYRCRFCQQAFSEVWDFVSQDQNIRYVLKELPILSPASALASRAAIAASEQYHDGRYLNFHRDLLFASSPLDEDKIMSLAARHEFDLAKLQSDMHAIDTSKRIVRNRYTAVHLGIQGTPSFVLGDEVKYGYLSRQELIEWAARLRAKANQQP